MESWGCVVSLSGLRSIAITDAGLLGCAPQNTYTFSAKGPSAVRLQPAEKKPRKFLFTISNTLERVWSHTQQYTTCVEWFTTLKEQRSFFRSNYKPRLHFAASPLLNVAENEVKFVFHFKHRLLTALLSLYSQVFDFFFNINMKTCSQRL